MADISITWDTARACGDWSFTTGDLATASPIESAVLVSLFSDRIAAPDAKLDERRGWWGDAYNTRPIGSRLWMLDRAKKVGQQPLLLQAGDYCNEALDYCNEALAWLVEDGIAAKVEVGTQWLSATALGIVITITKPDGSKLEPFRYSWAWG